MTGRFSKRTLILARQSFCIYIQKSVKKGLTLPGLAIYFGR